MKQKFTVLLFLAASFFLRFNILDAQVNTQDSLVLVRLYNSTGGTGWSNHNNWLTTAPVSTWFGITVSATRVTQIFLSGNNLTGTLPIELGSLDSLKNLVLEFNNLTGSIPTELGNIRSLTFLYLDYNNLSGGIPHELGNIPLEFLYLNHNTLKGKIPKELGNLKKLQALDLSYNKLTGSIPSELGNLQNVFNLLLRFNKLTGSIPAELGNLIKLQGLDLNSNQLTGKIPSALGGLPNLFRLSLDNNQLSGKVPHSLSNLSNLLFLYLQSNKLDGKIPSALSSCTKLAEIDVSGNQLSGEVPSSLTQLSNLTSLNLSVNKFTFAGMQEIAKTFSFAVYAPQAHIKLNLNSSNLSVNAGGKLSKNTYKWYRSATLVATKTGDSTYHPTQSGLYSVAVTNATATQLTLYSDTVNYNTGKNMVAFNVSQSVNRNKFSLLSVYPNPAVTNAALSFNADGKYTITVADVSGKILQTKTGISQEKNIVQLDVSKYASGVYLITITNENNRETVRLNKQ